MYRENCSRCEEYEKEIEFLQSQIAILDDPQNIIGTIYKYSEYCPKCKTLVYCPEYCEGRKKYLLFGALKCVKIPHLHQNCHSGFHNGCGYSWISQCADKRSL